MAVVNTFVVYSILDAKGKTSTMKVNFGPSPNLGMVTAWASAAGPLIANLIKGQIIDIGIGIGVTLPGGLPTSPDPDSDVEEGARFNWHTAIGALTNFRIPTFDEAHIATGTAQVDTTDADVSAFVDKVINGHTVLLENVQPTDERGSDINALKTAREAFQSSRN
jgi:hypothetical protein